MKWLAAFALAAGIVMLIRLFCIESYRISTDSMEEALHKGDYILVNKIPGKNKPVRGKVVLFTSPLAGFSGCSLIHQPLHRYAGRYDPGQHGRIYDKRA